MQKLVKILHLATFFFCINLIFPYNRLFLDTEYKISYNEYSNLDFDFATSTDSWSKMYSILTTTLKVLLNNVEYKTTVCSIGEFGSNYSSLVSTKQYLWEYSLPYPSVDFFPWFAEFYVKYKYDISFPAILSSIGLKIDNININFTLGRQRKEFVEGFVIGDNKIGYDGVSVECGVSNYFYLEGLLARVGSQPGFTNNRLFNLYSFTVGSKFFEDFDFGICNTVEDNQFINDKKIFYEFYIKRSEKKYNYVFEYAIQRGNKNNNSYSGSLWYFKGEMFGKNKYIGDASASMVWLLSSGGMETNQFSPSFTKMYDYTEPYGLGEFARANVKSIFFNLPDGYSGVFVLGMNLLINPIKNLYAGFNYYLFSSPNAPDNKPDPSSTEKTLGAKKAIGLEYDIILNYKLSDLTSLNFSYCIFNPTKNAYSKYPKGDNATKVSISLTTKF